MIIAVTGANGHVGVNLCDALIRTGHQVRALIHKRDAALKDIPVKKIRGDLLDTQTLDAFLDGVEIVFHLAARISISGNVHGELYRLNVEGTRNLVEKALKNKVRRFIHFSSIYAFDQFPYDSALNETRKLVGKNAFAYDRSKAEGEKIVTKAATNGLDAIVLCPTAIIGPMDPEPGLMGQAFLQIYHDKIPALVPGGYDMVDVRDIVGAAITSIEKWKTGEKYLLSGKWHSIKEISILINELTVKKTVKTEMPFIVAQIGLPFITLYSKLTRSKPLYTNESLQILLNAHKHIVNEKAKNELSFSPRDIRESIKDVFTWFEKNDYLKKYA